MALRPREHRRVATLLRGKHDELQALDGRLGVRHRGAAVLLRPMRAQLVSSLDRHERDGAERQISDGSISTSELAYMLQLLGKRKFSDHEVASMLDAADSNRDGKIDYHEFCQLMQKSLGSAGDGGSASPEAKAS